MTTPDGPEELAARVRLGAAVRALGHAVVGHHAPASELTGTAEVVEGLVAARSAGVTRRRDPDTFGHQFDEPPPPDGELLTTMADRPFSGPASPWGVDMVVRREGHLVVTEVVLGPAHEGAPGRSHGGVVSGTFDDLMGFVLHVERLKAFTGELTVRYLAGVPIGVPVTFRAWLRERVRRKLHIDADATAEGQLVASATAVFITVQ